MATDSSVTWRIGDEEKGRAIQPEPRPEARNTSRPYIARRSTSRRRSIDPATAIPIQFRSVSQDIDDAERQQQASRTKAKDAVALKFDCIDWHKTSITDIQKRLDVDAATGLDPGHAADRLKKHGANKLSPPPNPWVWKIMGYLFKGFGSILLVGGILVFVSWKPLGEPAPAVANLALGIVLIAVFLIQAAFNAWQDWSSSRVMESITAMLPEASHVIRGGHEVKVSSLDIVVGDVLLLKAGNKIPADVRYLEVSHDMSIDRAVLTGESKPIRATVDSTGDNYLETHCIGLQGTHCVSGSATGIVVSTGDETVFGQIAKLSGTPKPGLTTIEKEILRFVGLISIIMISWIVIIAAVWGGWLQKEHQGWLNVSQLIVSCVSVAIAYIPEGLPISVTASLTIMADIMKKNKILCKSLKTVETLGATSVICCDKTGTLTQNRMFVTDGAVGTGTFTAESLPEIRDNYTEHSAIHQLRSAAGLCNAASFDTETLSAPLAERRIFGNVTDQAALRFSEGLRSLPELRGMWTDRFELAFDSRNKFMAKLFTLADPRGLELCLSEEEKKGFGRAGNGLLLVKGAPDILLGRCTTVVKGDGRMSSLPPDMAKSIRELKDRWSSDGKRVILLARKVVGTDPMLSPGTSSAEIEEHVSHEVQGGLTLIGMLALIDPPRPEIPEVMRIMRGAGIRTFMVTGDFGLTALAIARQCDMVTKLTVHDNSALKRFPPETVALSSDEKKGKKMSAVPMSTSAPTPDAALVLTGADLLKLNDHQWSQVCAYPEIVFSRTTPDQKLRIVRELQARDEVVGMTGDGVNDAPALKAADIGISLASGSDIAMEAADMVLLDSFAAIVEAIKYGRLVFDNLKKIIAYLLPAGSWSEFWPVFTNVVFGLPQILSSFLMIIICCFTDCVAAVVLAYEKPEADLLLRPPRNLKTTKLVNWQLVFHAYAFVGMIESALSFTMAYWYLERQGVHFSDLWFSFDIPADIVPHLNVASSIYFINLVVMQWFNLMSVRTRHLSIFQHPPAFNRATQNLLLFVAIPVSLGIAVIWLYVPDLQTTLGTAGPPVEFYFLPAALGLGLLALDEARKAAVRRWSDGVLARMAW
ncbi:Na/K ATPase alpha 1 subunit [Apiospora saccharicola]